MDERTLELLHLELDGALAPAEAEDLRGRLAADPAAQRHRNQLQALDKALRGLLPAEPPAGFLDGVLQAARLTPEVQVASGSERWGQVFAPRRAHYGWAFAAGFALAVVSVVSLNPLPAQGPGFQAHELAGSLVRIGPRAARHAEPGPGMNVDLDPVQGRVELVRRAGVLAVEFDLDAQSPVEVELRTEGTGLGFAGLAQSEGELPGFAYDGQAVRLQGDAEHRFAVLLNGTPRAGSQVVVHFRTPAGAATTLRLPLDRAGL